MVNVEVTNLLSFTDFLSSKLPIAITGLGYVGLPLAVALSKHVSVIGFDVNEEKIKTYKSGIDPTNEVGNDVLKEAKIHFTSSTDDLRRAVVHIVAVPTPVKDDKTPDLSPLENACKTIGQNLQNGAVIIFESTVYPGVTEEYCVPILEKFSNMKCGNDFKVGYSPERINPGDREHRLENIVKVVSGVDEETLAFIANIYEMIVDAGVFRASSIKVAEAAKVI